MAGSKGTQMSGRDNSRQDVTANFQTIQSFRIYEKCACRVDLYKN